MSNRILFLEKLFFALFALLFVSIGFIYLKFDQTIEATSKNIAGIEVSDTKRVADTIDKNIRLYASKNLYDRLKNSPTLRRRLNKILSLYINKNIKYVYVIYKDRMGSFRYLLDGSKNPKERGVFKQKFIPISSIWSKCFKTEKDVFAKQRTISTLWITYLHPIIADSKMQGVLALDMSLNAYESIKCALNPLRNYIAYLLFFEVFVILIIILQIILFVQERRVARVDPLTRLYNRNYLKDKAKNIDLNHIYVAMIDIDFFKKVNDTYGHDVGDIVLRIIAKKIIAYTRGEDVLIRYGGEEFIILFSRTQKNQSDESIISIAKRVQEQISKDPIRVRDLRITVTVSMGLDPFTYKRSSLAESISIADEMLYLAKHNGRNRVEVAKS